MRRTTNLVIAALLVGAAAGAVGGAHVMRARMVEALHDTSGLAVHITRQLERQLDLDASQRALVEAAVRRGHAAMDVARSDAEQRLLGEFDAMCAEVESVLRDGQLERWRRIVERIRGRFLSP